MRTLFLPPPTPSLLSHELLRPWKTVTLAAGLAWLIWGALTLHIPDWDVGISLIMGLLTYVTAPWSVRILIQRRWRWIPLALFFWWFTVDGSYTLYHTLMGNDMLRLANFYASTALYWLCGFIWLHNGTLKSLWQKREAL